MSVQYIIGLDGTGAEVLVPANYGGIGPGAKPILTPQGAPATITAAAPNAFEVATAGSAVIVFTAGQIVTGAYIIVPPTNNGPIFIDTVNAPGLAAPGIHGTTEAIQPGGRWDAPGPLTGAVMANALADNQSFTAIAF